MTGTDRWKFKSDLLAIAAAADTGGDTGSPAEGEAAPGSEGSGAQRRRQKAAVAAAVEAAQQAQQHKSPAHAVRCASAGEAATEAQAEEAQPPPKKRSRISVSLPAGGDQAGGSALAQNSSAAAEATADAKPGRGAEDHTRRRASRRSSQEAMEAAHDTDMAGEDISPAEQQDRDEDASVLAPGLKLTLNRQMR